MDLLGAKNHITSIEVVREKDSDQIKEFKIIFDDKLEKAYR